MNGLTRTDYFELKVQGITDEMVRKKYSIGSPNVLRDLRKKWGLSGIKTQTFMRMMEKAREEDS